MTAKDAKEGLMIGDDGKLSTLQVDVEVLNGPNYSEHFFLGLRISSFYIR